MGRAREPTLGRVLREARVAKGLSLRDVQRAIGLDNAHLSQIETDRIARPELAILWDLAGLYGLDFDALLQRAGHAGARETPGRERQRLSVALRAMRELSAGEQAQVLRFIDELRSRGER